MSEQKIAFITGANRGVGFEVARLLAQRGHRVIIGSRNLHNGERAVEELKQGELEVELVQIDVADTSSILSAANEIVRRVDHLDILVNNAAYYVRGGSILDTTEKQLTSMLKTNAFSALLLTRSLWGLLKLGDHPGHIINVSSDLAQLSDLDDRAPAFSISKTALNAITVHLAAELRQHGIAVNAVCPGASDGEIWGEDTDKNLLESAETVAWLACDAPAELTGKFIRDKKEIAW